MNRHRLPPIASDAGTKMTFWSRNDATVVPCGSTDHWSKMRTRTGAIQVPVQDSHNASSLKLPPLTRANTFTSQNEFSKSNPEEASDQPVTSRQTTRVSGEFTQTLPRASVRRDHLGSAFNKRAKEGFRYWLIERPKPTSFGKYGMGSYKTVLGIGNAPRT